VARDPDEDEGTEVDARVGNPALIAASIASPSRPASPAEAEPSTSRLALRAPSTSLLARELTLSSIGRPSEEAAADDSSVSLVTPRFDSGRLAQLASADADDEVGTTKRAPVRGLEETTFDGGQGADDTDERTLDAPATPGRSAPSSSGPPMPRASPPDESVDEETTTRKEALLAPAIDEEGAREATAGLPPMRPRLDSEAAGQWPPWHAQPEEARAALRGVISPVSSGTEILPRTVVQEAFRMVDEAQAAPRAPRLQARDPLAHRLETPAPEPLIVAGTTAPPAASSARASGSVPSVPARRSISPFTVFVLAFLFTGGAFGGLIASRRTPMLGGGPPAPQPSATSGEAAPSAGAPPPPSATSSLAPSPSASVASSATAPVASSASAPPRASAPSSTSAPSAPLSTARPRTRGVPRRGKARP